MKNKLNRLAIAGLMLAPTLASASDLTDAAADVTTSIGVFAGLISGIAAAMVGAVIAVKFIKKIKGAV
jgi:hypothetical protein